MLTCFLSGRVVRVEHRNGNGQNGPWAFWSVRLLDSSAEVFDVSLADDILPPPIDADVAYVAQVSVNPGRAGYPASLRVRALSVWDRSGDGQGPAVKPVPASAVKAS